MNFNEIAKQFRQLLDINEVAINEMSMAWDYKKKNLSVCCWTEGPMHSDNRYFKYYNNESYNQATKVARIRIDTASYVGGNHREHNDRGKVLNWELSKSELRTLISILNSPSIDNQGCTKWQDILIRWNRDNFGIPAYDTMSGNIQKYQAKPGLLDKLEPFTIDFEMPNYLEL